MEWAKESASQTRQCRVTALERRLSFLTMKEAIDQPGSSDLVLGSSFSVLQPDLIVCDTFVGNVSFPHIIK